ncbi:MAG: hypothetical protein JWM44_1324 [Bacilli bacterium]|nr:hypothetical protein [Bacilli bacterium]
MEDKTLDQSLNIGSEIKLFEGCIKNVKIGSIKLIREVRQVMKDLAYDFKYSIGRDKWTSDDGKTSVDWPKVEAAYKKAFNMVLIGGLTDEEYENVDDNGLGELETLLSRFL